MFNKDYTEVFNSIFSQKMPQNEVILDVFTEEELRKLAEQDLENAKLIGKIIHKILADIAENNPIIDLETVQVLSMLQEMYRKYQ